MSALKEFDHFATIAFHAIITSNLLEGILSFIIYCDIELLLVSLISWNIIQNSPSYSHVSW